jgi:Ca2+-binding RTX toxin-like protein
MARWPLATLAGVAVLTAVVPAAAVPVGSGGPVDLSSEYDLRLDGGYSGERAGVSVARAGDVDGDGRGDVIVGSEVASYNGRSNAGAAWVAFGQPSKTAIDLSETGRGFRIEGPEPEARAGFSVSGAGDVNGDGKADVVVGAKGATFGASNAPAPPGAAYVVFGSSSTIPVDLANLGSRGFRIRAVTPGTLLQLGTSVSGGGDVNGDGLSDVVVGAPGARMSHGNAGTAFVIFGSGSTAEVDVGALGSRGFSISGSPPAANELGAGVAMLGDVDGDGRADVAAGAPACASCFLPSYVHVVRGKAGNGPVDPGTVGGWGYSIRQAASSANRIGNVIAAAGDVNGDGRPDLVLGDPGGFITTSQRSAYVVFGRATTGDTVDVPPAAGVGFAIVGPSGVENGFGQAVGGGGDVNGDGKADLVVGDRFADPLGRTNAGSSFVVFGKSDSTTVDALAPGAGGFRIDGASSNDESGGAVAGAGNVAGDARADVVIGAPAADERGRTLAGAAYLVAGAAIAPPPPPPDCTATNVLTGTDGGETLNGTSAADRIELRGGNDYTDGLGSGDCIFGELGEDHLFGGSGLDVLDGGPGQDEIKGGTTGDTIYGGPGADYYLAGEDGSDTIYPGPDNDSSYGGTGNDKVFDETGEDFVYGEAGADTLHGGADDDYVNGGIDDDKLYGDADDDRLYGDDGDDALYGGTGLDLLYGQNGTDTISGEADDDEVFAGPGPDVVHGNDGNDRLFGQEGDDQLFGDQLDDVIEGEGGNDTIDGNTGNDTIKGGSGADSLKGTAGNDTIDAADGEADSVDCGSGTDTAIVDAIDTVVGCETRTIASFATASLACPASAAGACTGVATYRAAGTRRTLGTARYAITPGAATRVVFSVRQAGTVPRAAVLVTPRKRSQRVRVAGASRVRKATAARP